MKTYYVYIMASDSGTLYIGVTSDLMKRVWEHRESVIDGFTKTYACRKLIYFEETVDVWSAMEREKQLKGWRRSWKEDLIRKMNPKWRDLWIDLV